MISAIKAALDSSYAQRQPLLRATVTSVPLVSGRTAGYVLATIAGSGGVRVQVDPDAKAPLVAGDTILVEGYGTPAATSYWAAGRISGARAASDVYQFPSGGVVNGQTYNPGDILLGSTLADWSNWLYEFELGRWQIRKGSLMHGAIGNLNGLYGYAAGTYGVAFGQYSSGQVNLTMDPIDGFRIRHYTTPVFQADTNGVVWALSSFKAGSGDDVVGIIATDATWRLYAGNATPGSAPFRVSKAGAVTATSGAIGGWTLASTSLSAGSGATTVGLDSGGSNPALYAGSATPASAPFRVTQAGALVATNATISGTVNAGAGTFDGLVQVGTSTPHLHLDGVNALLESSNYVAGSTGWRINASGNAEFNDILVRGAVKSLVFEKSQITAFAGSQIVAKSAGTLYHSKTIPVTGQYEIDVAKQGSNPAPFAAGDILFMKDGANTLWCTVVNWTDATTFWAYTVATNSGDVSVTYQAGTAIVDYGQAGQGYYIVSADGLLGASAAWALRSHAGAPWTTQTTHVYAGTDGKLYAGGGSAILDANGVSLLSGTDVYYKQGAYSMMGNSTTELGALYSFLYTNGNTYIGLRGNTWTNAAQQTLEIIQKANATKQAMVTLQAFTPANAVNAQINMVSDGNSSIEYIAAAHRFTGNGTVFTPRIGPLSDGTTAIQFVKADGSTSFVTLDTTNERVGIGVTPSEKLHVSGNMQYTGDLKPYRNSTAYTSYTFVPLSSPLTSTSWDGDAYSTTALTLLDLSAVFGAPAGIKAILARVSCRDSASATTNNLFFALTPTNAGGTAHVLVARPSGLPNDYATDQAVVVPCTGGDVYYQIGASGSGTMDVWFQIWGYWI